MSELKARHAFDVYEEYTKTGDDEAAQVYLKSEADNVISTIRAERDEYRYNLSCARNEIHNMQVSVREDVKRIADKDKVIAEKDKEIAELKQKLEDTKATAYAESVDAGMENRKLKRALWLSRTEMARTSAWVFWNRNDDYNYNKWKKVERKCRAKAEEYK